MSARVAFAILLCLAIGCGSTETPVAVPVDAGADRTVDAARDGAGEPPGGWPSVQPQPAVPPPPNGWGTIPPPPPISSMQPPRDCRAQFPNPTLPSRACPRTLNDSFDTDLSGWSYFEKCLMPGDCTGGYALTLTMGAARIAGDAYYKNAGMQKSIPVDFDAPFLLRFRWRATGAIEGPLGVNLTNATLTILDESGTTTLHTESLVPVNLGDRLCWQFYSRNLATAVAGHSRVIIQLSVNDIWTQDFHQEVLFDDIQLDNCNQARQ